jgi:formylglycine-generating enzyme required for sulfatase activity
MHHISLVLGLAVTGFAFPYAARPSKVQPSAQPGTASIPGREFTMGPDSELGWSDQKPGHYVRVNISRMDDTDFTRAQLTRPVLATHGPVGHMGPERHAVRSSPRSA